jgi:hypothetical protein
VNSEREFSGFLGLIDTRASLDGQLVDALRMRRGRRAVRLPK